MTLKTVHKRAKKTKSATRLQMEKHLRSLLDQYAQRVRQGEKATEVFADLNTGWTIACSKVSGSVWQKDRFAKEVTNLNQLTLKVEKRINRDKAIGAIFFWGVIIIGLAGLIYIGKHAYIIYDQHLQFIF